MATKNITPSPLLVATLLNIFTITPANVPVPDSVLVERTGEDLRYVRAGIKTLIEQHGLPIVSNRKHAYVLSTKAGYLLAEVERLRSQARRTDRRADALVDYVNRIGQLPAGYLDTDDDEIEQTDDMS